MDEETQGPYEEKEEKEEEKDVQEGVPNRTAAAAASDSGGVNARTVPGVPELCAASRPSGCCHGGEKMAVLAYSLGKREINQYFNIKNAKLISSVIVVLLFLFHTASRYYGGKCSPVKENLAPALKPVFRCPP